MQIIFASFFCLDNWLQIFSEVALHFFILPENRAVFCVRYKVEHRSNLGSLVVLEFLLFFFRK